MSPLAEVDFEEHAPGVIVATLRGEVDGSNASEIRRAVADAVPAAGRRLVLDLSATTYVDSAGVDLIFQLARRLAARRQRLGLVVPPGSGPRRVLELCDVGSVATLAATRDEAAGEVPAGPR